MHHNPFTAIREIATERGLEQKLYGCLLDIDKWPYVDHKTFFDDLLAEIYGATGIRVRFDRSNDDYVFTAEVA